MSKQTTMEFNLNKTSDFNEYLKASLVSNIKEILQHFKVRYRKSPDDMYDEDARYLYKQIEVDMFFKMNDNPNLQIEPQFDEGASKPWCWRISRIDNKK